MCGIKQTLDDMLLDGLSIIIPTKDRGTVFNRTLEATYFSTIAITAEIIVINDSKTDSPYFDEKYKDRVKILNNPSSGVASARNLGAKTAIYSRLLFLDDDIIISTDNIISLIENVKKYPGCAFNFNWIYPFELNEKISKTQFGRYLIENGFTSLKGWSNNLKWNDNKIFEVDLLASYFLFIDKHNFNLIGGYNESFPHAGAEDFEFAMRLKKAGIKGLCDPLNTVLHNEEDRVELLPWIYRKERAAETRKIAVDLGYNEIAIKSYCIKVKVNQFLYHFRSILFFILNIIPNRKIFDTLYFKIVNRVLGIYLHRGYFKYK